MSYSTQLPMQNVATPTAPSGRLASLDVLRGVAVLGILVMNIYAFAMPFAAYANPLAMGGTEPHNLGTWVLTHVLFDQKFMSIFSMLFGAGIVLMGDRAAARGAAFGRIFYRRQVVLLLLGLLHAYLIWFGDILFFYAVTGMIVYLLRNQSPRRLIAIACLMLPVALFLSNVTGTYLEDLEARAAALVEQQAGGTELNDDELAVLQEWQEMQAAMAPGDEEIEDNLRAYRGSYSDILAYRAPEVFFFHVFGFLFFVLWRVGGMMLLGMALMKLGILSAERSLAFYRRLALLAYGLGLPLTIASAWTLHAHDYDPIWVARVGGISNYIGSALVGLGHVGLVMIVVKTGLLASLMARFAAVGRMALTNYLMHSVVMTSIFYGYGLGLYGAVPRIWQMAFVAAMIACQLVLSPWWLARYRFGPAEWLWRSLTYGTPQAMRRLA